MWPRCQRVFFAYKSRPSTGSCHTEQQVAGVMKLFAVFIGILVKVERASNSSADLSPSSKTCLFAFEYLQVVWAHDDAMLREMCARASGTEVIEAIAVLTKQQIYADLNTNEAYCADHPSKDPLLMAFFASQVDRMLEAKLDKIERFPWSAKVSDD